MDPITMGVGAAAGLGVIKWLRGRIRKGRERRAAADAYTMSRNRVDVTPAAAWTQQQRTYHQMAAAQAAHAAAAAQAHQAAASARHAQAVHQTHQVHHNHAVHLAQKFTPGTYTHQRFFGK